VTRVRELEAQLAQAAKLEAIGQLAGGVAHDFNNILTAILGYVTFIGDALPPDSPVLEDLRQIAAAGERAQRLTAQLLAFGRRNVLRPAVTDVGQLLEELTPMLGRLIGEDIELRLERPEHAAIAFVDPGQLQQSVINLVVNARNAMPEGGEIVVAADVREGDGERVEHGRWVVVAVRDTGTGIAPEVLDRIFEPFFTTDEFGRGTGLGLAVVDGFVRQSSGHVTVATEPGRGSAFELWLPVHVAPEHPEAPDMAMPTAVRVASRPLTILVAEDEAVVRAIVRRGLALAGHRVLLASSGQEALDVAARFDGPIDVLLSDVVMPGIRGPQLAEAMRRARPGIRVVLASGYTEDEVTRRGILVGAEAFLAKPYSMETLLAAVEGTDSRTA
jgi:CheY-like chemotaxis protein